MIRIHMDRKNELMRVRDVRRRMSLRLAGWAGASMIVALIGFVAQPSIAPGVARQLSQAVAAQCLLWGLIDVGFAMFGLRQAQSADRAPINSSTIDRELSDRDRLIRLLRFSAKLNLGWIALAIVLIALGAGLRNAMVIGHGIGVMLQGGFLLAFERSFLKLLTPANS
jgi:hypothetical protein